MLAPEANRHWRARLDLHFAPGEGRTKLVRARHQGPLRVQRPFYPEGNCCHVYLLHPPGGIAPGDKLDVELHLDSGSHALATTPAAGKVYTCDAQGSRQRQSVQAHAQAGSCLEWLPQETIVFSGARVQLHNHFHLTGDAQLMGWDIICLGRRAHGEQFLQGDCDQLIDITRDGDPLHHERTRWRGGEALLQAPWGMGGQVVAATFFATLDSERRQLDTWRDGLAQLDLPGEWGITQKPGILLARYLGQSALQARRGFCYLWSQLRPLLSGHCACAPRIWNT